MNLTEDQHKSIARLEAQNAQEWRTFKDILRSAREQARDDMETCAEVAYVRQAQGKSLILSDLIACIEESREVAKKMSERSR
jgi:hypothetical protein